MARILHPTRDVRLPPLAQTLLVDAPAPAVVPDPGLRNAEELPADGAYCRLDSPKIGPQAWTARVPDEVVRALLEPGPMLVVGDAPGDPDCFCSAVALARGREALGRPTRAHVDAPPPRQVQGLLQAGDLCDAAQVTETSFSTVVFVDNDATRVGRAAQAAMRAAERVVIIDHHDVDPTHESLGLDPKTELVVWKDTEADAAALMVLATLLRTVEQSGANWLQGTWTEVLQPLVGAMYSDTRGFEAARTRPSTLGVLQTLLDTQAIDLGATLEGFGGGIDRKLIARLVDGIEEQPVVAGDSRLGTFTLSGERLLEVWTAAREQTPELTWSDLLFRALDHVEAQTRAEDYDVTLFSVGARTPDAEANLPAALLDQLPPKALKFSVRTRHGELAPKLAQALGGGGKLHEGGGISDAAPEQLVRTARSFLEAQSQLAKSANLLNLGGV